MSSWFLADYEALIRFAYFVSGDRNTAEDLVQEAFARVSSAADRLADEGFSGYARRTVVNLHRTAFRRRSVEQRFLRRFRPKEAAYESDHAGAMDMRRALLSLPARQRACLALRFYEDLKEREIADAMGMSLDAVKKEIERAKRRLRETLGERGSA